MFANILAGATFPSLREVHSAKFFVLLIREFLANNCMQKKYRIHLKVVENVDKKLIILSRLMQIFMFNNSEVASDKCRVGKMI